jgi:hypothetical protein
MEPMFSSAWLELAMVGLATAVVANRRLSSTPAARSSPIKLVDGDRVEEAAKALNLALGFNEARS